MDIGGWLRSLGLEQYEAVFRENDIDKAVLPSLTHENLKELGVASFGHRVKLLDAIAALRRDASGKPPSVDPATASSAPSTPPEDRAERRQVTVMFSDLVGSTALSAGMDPEDLSEVIRLSEMRCRHGKFGGTSRWCRYSFNVFLPQVAVKDDCLLLAGSPLRLCFRPV